MPDLLDAVRDIEPVLRAGTDLGEVDTRLPEASLVAMRKAGLFGMWVPRALGGLELDPVGTFRVIEEVARIDAAAGWNLQLSVGFSPFGAWLPDEGAKEIFGPDVVVAGTLFPPAQAVSVSGGYRLTGRAPFVSGCHGADWFLAPAAVEGDPTPIVAFFPASDAEIVEHWDTLGMRGTGSHDVAVTDRFVPARRTGPFVPFADRPPGGVYQGPLYRLVFWHSVAALAAPALGIARAAIDDLVSLAGAKTPAYASTPLRDRVTAQSQVAQARAELDAARAYLHGALAEAWQTCRTGALLSTDQRAALQLASTHAAQAAAAAVRLVHACAGTSGIRNEWPFARHFRNVHTITQHAFISAARYEDVGRTIFGLKPEWPFFAF